MTISYRRWVVERGITEILGVPIDIVLDARRLCFSECRAGQCSQYGECGTSWPSCSSGAWEATYLTKARQQAMVTAADLVVLKAIVG